MLILATLCNKLLHICQNLLFQKKPPFSSSLSVCETCSDASGEVVLRPNVGRLATTTPSGTYLRKTLSTNDLQKYGKRTNFTRVSISYMFDNKIYEY